MGISPLGTCIILIITGGTTALATFSVFANIIGHETQLHDLRNRVKDLQYKHLLYLAKQDGRISDSAQPVTSSPLPAERAESSESQDEYQPELASESTSSPVAQAA